MPEPFNKRYNAEEPPRTDWQGTLARLESSFGRYTLDIGGIILLAVALMLLLAILDLTGGLLLSFVAGQLSLCFGGGSYLLVIATAIGGLMLMRPKRQDGGLRWGRVIAIEIAAFAALAMLSMAVAPAMTRRRRRWSS